MNLTTIKAFIKKHTQSPEEYITEFDVEEMNEWLQVERADEVKNLADLGIKISFIRALDPREEDVQMTNDFWLLLAPEDGLFAIRQFAKGSVQAKNLASAGFDIAQRLAVVHARVVEAFPARGALCDVTCEDWEVVVPLGPKGPSRLKDCALVSPYDFSNDDIYGNPIMNPFLAKIQPDIKCSFADVLEKLCIAQENFKLLQDKEFISAKFFSSQSGAETIEMVVADECSMREWADRGVTGFPLSENYAIFPVEYEEHMVKVMVGVDLGKGFVPLLEGTHARLSCGGTASFNIQIFGSGCSLSDVVAGKNDDDYDSDDILLLELSDTDLKLAPGTLEMLSLGKSPLEMLKFARGETSQVQESYDFDFSMDDQATDNGMSL